MSIERYETLIKSALEIVGSAGGIEKVKAVAFEDGSEAEADESVALSAKLEVDAMGMQYIRSTYKVPAKRGVRVRMIPAGGEAFAQCGVITGSRGINLLIKMDGERKSQPYHPTWCLEYI